MNFPKIKKNYQKIKSILGLSLSLAKARFKLKNEGSYLGILWYLLNPLSMFLILLFLRNALHKTTIEYYPVYLFLGLIMFNFFRQATNTSSNTIISNSGFIKSMKINYEPFVVSVIIQSVFSHIFEVAILAIFMVYFGVPLWWLFFYPIIFFIFAIFTTGVSFIVSVIGAYANDFSNAWAVFLNVLWFATPIYYVASKGNAAFLNELNPIYYFIDIARSFVISGKFPGSKPILIILALSTLFFVAGVFIFEKHKKKFSELI